MARNSILDLTAAAILIAAILIGLGIAIALSERDRLQKRKQMQEQRSKLLTQPQHILASSTKLRPGRLPLTLPPSLITVLRQPAVQGWLRELREIRDPLVRAIVGWPLFLWRVWDWFRLNWFIKRSLKALDRSKSQLEKAWSKFHAARMAEEEQSGKSQSDE
jgi:hypothetical protein